MTDISFRPAVAGDLPGIGPDSKSQVTLEFVDGKPRRATSVVVSTQHTEDLSQDDVRELALPVLRHRVLCNYFAESDGKSVDDVLTEMIQQVGS